MLSALSKMAARNCIFVKCFLKKTRKNTPLQLNFECSGAFWLNLVTLHCESEHIPVRNGILFWQFLLIFALCRTSPAYTHSAIATVSPLALQKYLPRAKIFSKNCIHCETFPADLRVYRCNRLRKKGWMPQTSLLLIKGTVAEQTVKIFFFFYLMAWKILTLPVLKKLISF